MVRNPFQATFALVCAALALVAPQRAASEPPLDGAAIFARAKATFRTHPRPPYVVYTLTRVENVDGVLNPSDTYSLRIWYRSADRAALARRVIGGRATGGLFFLRVAFNQPIDPGPPTTDIFEPVPPRGFASPAPLPSDPLRTIQNVTVTGELDYRIIVAKQEGDAYHLWLAALRDPERNRLRELWVDTTTYEVRRVKANDRLYFIGEFDSVPDLFDMSLVLQNGVPVIAAIDSTTAIDNGPSSYGPLCESSYRYDDVSFPPTLPAWYFQPQAYGAHAAEAPQT